MSYEVQIIAECFALCERLDGYDSNYDWSYTSHFSEKLGEAKKYGFDEDAWSAFLAKLRAAGADEDARHKEAMDYLRRHQ